jgi:hypothetical protein
MCPEFLPHFLELDHNAAMVLAHFVRYNPKPLGGKSKNNCVQYNLFAIVTWKHPVFETCI